MIQIQIDADKAINEIEYKLGVMYKKAPKAVRTASNKTAKKAQNLLVRGVKRKYALNESKLNEKSDGVTDIKSALKMEKATTGNPAATLHSKGYAIDLFKFKSSPDALLQGTAKPKRTKAKAKKGNSLKKLYLDGRWAFVVQYKSGHLALAERITKKRLPIENIYSIPLPKMFGSMDVYGAIEPQVQEMLDKHIDTEISKWLAKGG